MRVINLMSKTKCHYHGKFLSLLERDNWEYAERVNTQGVVVIVATTDDKDLVLVEQFRTPVNSQVIELPAGLMGDIAEFRDETVFAAADRELQEETGFEARHWSNIMHCPASAGMSSETLQIVRAKELNRTGPGGGDSSEDIMVHIIPLNKVDKWLADQQLAGKLLDPKIYSALYWISQEQ